MSTALLRSDHDTDNDWGKFKDATEPQVQHQSQNAEPSPYAHMRGQYSLENSNAALSDRLKTLAQSAMSGQDPDAHFEYYELVQVEKAKLLEMEADVSRMIWKDPTVIDRAKAIPAQLHELEQHEIKARQIIAMREGLGNPRSGWDVHDRVDGKIAQRREELKMEREKAEIIAFASKLEAKRIELQTLNMRSDDALFHVEKSFFRRKAEVTVNLGPLSQELAARFPSNRLAQKIAADIKGGKYGGSLEKADTSIIAMVNNEAVHLSQGAGRNSTAAGLAGVGRITESRLNESQKVVGDIAGAHGGISPYANQNIRQIAESAGHSPENTRPQTEAKSVAPSLFERTKSRVGDISNSVRSSISSVMESGRSLFSRGKDAVQSGVENTKNSVQGTVSSVRNSVSKWFSVLRGSHAEA